MGENRSCRWKRSRIGPFAKSTGKPSPASLHGNPCSDPPSASECSHWALATNACIAARIRAPRPIKVGSKNDLSSAFLPRPPHSEETKNFAEHDTTRREEGGEEEPIFISFFLCRQLRPLQSSVRAQNHVKDTSTEYSKLQATRHTRQ